MQTNDQKQIEFATRLRMGRARLNHERIKDAVLNRTICGIVVAATFTSLWLVISGRYPAIQDAAMVMLAAIVSGGVGYATGKSSK